MPLSDVINVLRLRDLQDLVLKAHQHKVEQLGHACCVKFHDRRVCKLLKDLLNARHRVHLLRPEQLLLKTLVQHTLDNIAEHLQGPVLVNILRTQPLVKNVNHLPAKI